ncbi:unnamed protein product [Mycena citricolor]|uniref:Phytase-like domain-containing protein n=1 Tax=Mycena citricolor TaxID=2018698 RepID=A0AAD2HTW6_9AGAR|nr:unnamed protein product [Mycena citricolor]
MFTQLVALTLGALSFASAAPSRQQLFSDASCGTEFAAPTHKAKHPDGFNNGPRPGTYEITAPKFGSALLHTYRVGEPLVLSRALLFPGPYGQYELDLTDENTMRLKHLGHNTAVVVDEDRFISTASQSRPHEFTLEAGDDEGHYVVQSAQGRTRGLVWTLNPGDTALMSRIVLAPFRGQPSQYFQFSAVERSVLGLEHLAAHTGLRAPVASPFSKAGPVSSGTYRIIDGRFGGLVRSYNVGQTAYTTIGRDFPGDFGAWIVVGDELMGYTIVNAGHRLPLVLTDSKNLAPIPGRMPARFRFVSRSQGRVSVALLDGEGVWGVDSSNGPMHASIEIQSEKRGEIMQEFTFAPMDNMF